MSVKRGRKREREGWLAMAVGKRRGGTGVGGGEGIAETLLFFLATLK